MRGLRSITRRKKYPSNPCRYLSFVAICRDFRPVIIVTLSKPVDASKPTKACDLAGLAGAIFVDFIRSANIGYDLLLLCTDWATLGARFTGETRRDYGPRVKAMLKLALGLILLLFGSAIFAVVRKARHGGPIIPQNGQPHSLREFVERQRSEKQTARMRK
jgi:hypothetical protein